MFDALSAEWLKLSRHKATWFLVWVYPIGLLLIFALAVGGAFMTESPPVEPSLERWLADTAYVWNVPSYTLGRYLLAAFVAVVFAGEYGWNTWKLVVPHRSRASLLWAKFATLLLLFTVAFALGAVVSVIGCLAEDLASGDVVPAGITAGAVLRTHGQAALSALAPGLVTIGYAALAAVLTRSTIAALVIAIVAVTAEQLFFNFAPILSLKAPGLVWALYQVLPGYHLANIGNWVASGSALSMPLMGSGIVAHSWAVSLGAAAAWIGALWALTFGSFSRQDLN